MSPVGPVLQQQQTANGQSEGWTPLIEISVLVGDLGSQSEFRTGGVETGSPGSHPRACYELSRGRKFITGSSRVLVSAARVMGEFESQPVSFVQTDLYRPAPALA
jgi:hypothetical protein